MNLDGLKRLLGMATKGAGQVGKVAAQAGQAVGEAVNPLRGAAKLMGKPMGQLKNLPTLREPRQLPGKLLEPMPYLKELQPMQPRPMMARDGSMMPTTTFGPRRDQARMDAVQPYGFMGQQYAENPQSPDFRNVDPGYFGYPPDEQY